MIILAVAGIALLVAAFTRWRDPSADLLLGLGNILLGIANLAADAPWVGAVDLAAGEWLLWHWWRKRGDRERIKRALGAKSAALRAALVRTVRDRAVPVPA